MLQFLDTHNAEPWNRMVWSCANDRSQMSCADRRIKDVRHSGSSDFGSKLSNSTVACSRICFRRRNDGRSGKWLK